MDGESPATVGEGAIVAPDAERSERDAPEYVVPDWIRVRRESFGLLFYDTRSTRLTFVRCGESLVPPPFTAPRRVIWLVQMYELL